MEIHKLMVRNTYTGTEYCDSYYIHETNATEALRVAEEGQSTSFDPDEWTYWIATVTTKD